MDGRVDLLRDVASLLAPHGVLFLATSVVTPQLLSRHFDLLLRSQQGLMQLSDVATLLDQPRDAGLTPSSPRPIAPGAPVVTLTAVRAG